MTPLLHRIVQRLLPLSRHNTFPDTRRRDKRLRQRGFALGQALVTAAVLGGVGVVGTDWASQQRQSAVLEAQNAVYARINNGVGVYMTLYYPKLIDRSTYPDSCATASYPRPASPASGCSATVSYIDAGSKSKKDYVLNNILQPTLADLQTLGLVDPLVPAAPLLPVNATVATDTAAGSSPAAYANVYGIVIKRVPAGTDVNLESLVYNVQPYMLTTADISALLRMSDGAGATSGVPDRDAATSSINPQFDLKGYAGAWSAANPVQQTVGSKVIGMPGIMAWRNGFAAAASLEMIRRDGTLKPTADWNFDNHSITNLNQVQAKEVITDSLTTSTLTVKGAAQFNKTLDVKGTLTALSDLVVKGASDIQTLVVHGKATFEQPVAMQASLEVAGKLTARGVVSASSVNVENGAQLSGAGTLLKANGDFISPGSSCTQNLALAQDGMGRLMMCTAGAWQAATNNVYGLSLVNEGNGCNPDGSAAYLPSGLMAICRSGTWQAAVLGTQVAGQSCSTKGMMAAEITAQGVSNLLVCQAGGSGGLTWSPSIYARTKAELAREGSSCSTDQINAVARNNSGPDSGLLMCTSNGVGGAQWRVPFKKYTEETIDSNEYLAVDFSWKDWYANPGSYWGQTIIGPITLNHWKNGVIIESWNNLSEMRGPDNGLYVSAGNAGGDYPDENYSRARFNFDRAPLNPSEWTTPIFRRPAFTCTNCYLADDGRSGGPDRRDIFFKPGFLEFYFYNKGGSDYGVVHYYQLVMFKKMRWTYLSTE